MIVSFSFAWVFQAPRYTLAIPLRLYISIPYSLANLSELATSSFSI